MCTVVVNRFFIVVVVARVADGEAMVIALVGIQRRGRPRWNETPLHTLRESEEGVGEEQGILRSIMLEPTSPRNMPGSRSSGPDGSRCGRCSMRRIAQKVVMHCRLISGRKLFGKKNKRVKYDCYRGTP